ncbi:phage head closure protein [Sporosarcina contaminans]|uniref:Phage head closure protein n=1 Tax=Sporosarcina contaminans TaxID=633403 RepID=A0ABW3TTP4_9BACL
MSNWDQELVLIEQFFEEDELGNQIPTVTRREVLCKKKSVGRTEFYSAANSDMRPEIVLVVHTYEYQGERKVEFEGHQYSVLRTYSENFEELELTCERVGADVKS